VEGGGLSKASHIRCHHCRHESRNQVLSRNIEKMRGAEYHRGKHEGKMELTLALTTAKNKGMLRSTAARGYSLVRVIHVQHCRYSKVDTQFQDAKAKNTIGRSEEKSRGVSCE